jgi:hypothetical protein
MPLIADFRSYKKVRSSFDKYLSSEFNLVGIFTPNENKLSDLIAEMLKPDGFHSQGEKFIKLFIEELRKEHIGEVDFSMPFHNIQPKREFTTFRGRRIDIVIEFDNLVIGFENKPWAAEQDRQIKDYKDFLDTYCRNKKTFLIIYLSGSGQKPTSIDEAEREEDEQKGTLRVLSYKGFLLPWLQECYRDCESEKLRYFLKDFILWIDNNFEEALENNE